MRILILGSKGQIGDHLNIFLKNKKHQVYGLDILNSSSEDLRIVVDSHNFIELLSSAKAVISNGGTTYIESLLLGKSVLPIPQTDDEEYFVDTISPITSPDLTLPGFLRLDDQKASKAGVGFYGAERICRIIKEGL